MAKKAFLVTFNICTRVVADCGNDENPLNDREKYKEIVKEASDRILSDPEAYLDWDNADVDTDKDMPYDPDYDN